MTHSQIYSEATGKAQRAREKLEEEKPLEEEKDAGRAQLEIQWLQSTITQEMFFALHESKKKLSEVNVALALQHGVQTVDNSKQIVHNLIRIDTINNIINTYGKLS